MIKNTFIGANFALLFLLELMALAAIGWWGFKTGSGVDSWLLGLGIPAGAMVLWGMYAAPHAVQDIPWMAVAVKVLVFDGAAIALLVCAGPRWALIYATAAVLNLIIVHLPRVSAHFAQLAAKVAVHHQMSSSSRCHHHHRPQRRPG